MERYVVSSGPEMATEGEAPWPAFALAREFQQAGERAFERQVDLVERLLGPGAGGLNPGVATFKTRVQSGGRLSIPDAEREALDIREGDIVQAMVVPLREGGGRDE